MGRGRSQPRRNKAVAPPRTWGWGTRFQTALCFDRHEDFMALHWIWWIAAALAVGTELLTGTFYLLAIGVAVAAGGIAAWLGWSLEMQFLVAGALGVALTIVAHN